ncbi:MAG: RDD family protein [Chitinophagales bacterium]
MELLEELQPETPVTASKTRRVVAALIDIFVLFVFGTIIAALTGQTNPEEGTIGFSLHGWPAAFFNVGAYLIMVVPEGLTSKTIGKWFLNLKVVKRDGNPNNLRSSAIRHLLDFVDCFLLIGLFIAARDANNQRLGDRAADTIVVDG